MSHWAARPLDVPAGEVLEAVRRGITVASISTPRRDFVTRPKRQWPSFEKPEEIKPFDHVPVTEGDHIVGVFDKTNGAVVDLSETMFMASDAGLLSFLEVADKRKFALLVEDERIAGLVTLSDIQKLPVYCALFSLVMTVEMVLMDWIRKRCAGDSDRWLDALENWERDKLNKFWCESSAAGLALDRLTCASFGQELRGATRLGLFGENPGARKAINSLKELRDCVCHGKDIALTPERALQLPSQVRTATGVLASLENALQELKS